MNETYVTIKGRLVADPTVRTTRAGAPMTSFRIASSVRRPVSGRPGVWEDAETSFYEVVTYRALAANVGVSVRKGHPVSVHGRQHIVSRARDDGSTWWGVEVVADAVGHDLSYGTAAFTRVSRGQFTDAERPAPPEVREGITEVGFGDPERDPYVVEVGPGGAAGLPGHGGVGRDDGPAEMDTGAHPSGGSGDPAGEGDEADSGPLVPVTDGDAA